MSEKENFDSKLYLEMAENLSRTNEDRFIEAYENMPARNIGEQMENIYDRVRDALGIVTLPVRLPIALTKDLFYGIFGRHYAGNEFFAAEVLTTKTRSRAIRRYWEDRDKILAKRAGKK